MTPPPVGVDAARSRKEALPPTVQWACAHNSGHAPTHQLGRALRGKEGMRMPTGVAIRDARQQLFDAAERVLLRAGPSALTSRAVTTEAGCAKGVLHRHFVDFDEFLVELIRDRTARVTTQADALLRSAGTGTVAGNLTAVLTDLFSSV